MIKRSRHNHQALNFFFLDPFQISQILIYNVCSTCSLTCIPETLDHFNSYCHSPFPNKNVYFSLALLLQLPHLFRLLFIAPGHILFMDCPCKAFKWPANYNYNCLGTFCHFYYRHYWFTQLQDCTCFICKCSKIFLKKKEQLWFGNFSAKFRLYLIRL